MLAEASGFAVLACLYPFSLVVVAVYLASDRARPVGLMFVVGALAASTVMAVALYFILKSSHLEMPKMHQARYGLRLGLGILALVLSGYLLKRPPRQKPAEKKKRSGIMDRLLTNPTTVTAFVLGFGLFFFSTSFIAAVQVVATARAGTAMTTLALLIIVIIYAATAWLPYVLYLIRPERTSSRLRALNEWLAAHLRFLAQAGIALVGALLTIDGILGLTGSV